MGRRSVLWLAGALLAGLAGAGRLQAVTPAEPLGRAPEFRLKDTAGKTRSLAEFRDRKAIVLLFISARCPISNSYAEPLSRMERRFRPRGVQFLAVNSQPDESAREVARHAAEYRLGFPVLKDSGQALADALNAQVTPEAFVVDSQRRVRYRGRIDDAYASRTQKRAQATSRDLEEALEAVLAEKEVARPVTEAFGCALPRKAGGKTDQSAAVTYHREVAPILQEHCQSCHRPGQVAPFSLLTYADARKWGAEIKTFTGGRQMPPWKPEPGHGEFEGVRRLDDREIALLGQWVDAGMPEGNPKNGPAPRQWPEGWMLGKPDLELTVSEPYQVAATGDDEFRVFVLPTRLTESRQVAAIDFRPGNARVVHHVVSFVDTTGKARELDAGDPGPGYNSGPGGIKVPGASIQGVWAPGNLPRFLPPGVGRPLPQGADLVIQVHYHKTGKPETDQTKVGLYFAKEPVTKTVHTAIFGPFNIDIPPGEASHEQKFKMQVPADVRILTIMPHMHLLGKEMRVTATLPDGTVKDMVWIKDWDYRWQDSYRYKEPVLLPRGTQVEVVARYDNSAANPLNPSSPPRRVRFGEQTTDEMGFAIMEVLVGS
jgi:peroxiredoxin